MGMRAPGIIALLALAALAVAAPVAAGGSAASSLGLAPGGLFADPSGAASPAPASPLALAGAGLAAGGLERGAEGQPRREFAPITAERAQLLLRSLTVPGWGQATLGRKRSATAFALAELGAWATFTAFRIQVQMRREAYERSARILAGIELDGRDEEFRRIVGSYLSSDEYNLYVVYRDAANLHYDDPDAYRRYIAEHELGSADHWEWDGVESLLRYRAQRKNTTQAAQRANTVLALAIVNRLVSALHVARAARDPGTGDARKSWNFEVSPSDPNDATAYRLGIRARF